ncbi:MAG: hypothetical protein QM664_04640 [Flavihumibacter sp.]
MKKNITGAVLFVLLSVSFAFAHNDKNKAGITPGIETAFYKEFSNAKDANWTKFQNYYRVQFTLNDRIFFALQNLNGEVIGFYRNILSTQLPIQLEAGLKKNYNQYWISELFELVQDNQTFYYVTLENANNTVTLKSENGADWSSFQQSKK